MIPPPAPSIASGNVSIINCRTMRLRFAPSATRTPSSRDRPVARDSTRLPTLVAATTSTSVVKAPRIESTASDAESLSRVHEVHARHRRLEPFIGGHHVGPLLVKRRHQRAHPFTHRRRRHSLLEAAVHVHAVGIPVAQKCTVGKQVFALVDDQPDAGAD